MSLVLTRLVMTVGLAGVPGGELNFNAVRPVVEFNERSKVPDIWVLDFTFRSPRFIMVDVPGRGRQLVWYMAYTVINRSDKPRVFLPDFTLVTESGKVYKDSIMPAAERAVIAREEPTQLRLVGTADASKHRWLNSVTISRDPIPPSKSEETPEYRHGVVFWEDVDMSTKKFTIYVTGLSNGYQVVADDKGKKETVKRKTLMLEFTKPGDVYNPDENEIKFLGDAKWIYR